MALKCSMWNSIALRIAVTLVAVSSLTAGLSAVQGEDGSESEAGQGLVRGRWRHSAIFFPPNGHCFTDTDTAYIEVVIFLCTVHSKCSSTPSRVLTLCPWSSIETECL